MKARKIAKIGGWIVRRESKIRREQVELAKVKGQLRILTGRKKRVKAPAAKKKEESDT